MDKAYNVVDTIKVLKRKGDWHKLVHPKLIAIWLEHKIAEDALMGKQVMEACRYEAKGKNRDDLLRKHHEQMMDLRFNNAKASMRLICKLLPSE